MKSPAAFQKAAQEWGSLPISDKKIYQEMSANSKYVYRSKDKNLNKFLKHLRRSFDNSRDINVPELQGTICFLEKWKAKVLRGLK